MEGLGGVGRGRADAPVWLLLTVHDEERDDQRLFRGLIIG
jgi:hypothetical protein